MTENSIFRSRIARLSCSREAFYNFITDIRNFREFVTADIVSDWEASADACRLKMKTVGEVRLQISKKEPFSLVTYSGDALQQTEFNIDAFISDDGANRAEVKLIVRADLNPFLKMMANGPIESFLDTLVSEMEKYDGWIK